MARLKTNLELRELCRRYESDLTLEVSKTDRHVLKQVRLVKSHLKIMREVGQWSSYGNVRSGFLRVPSWLIYHCLVRIDGQRQPVLSRCGKIVLENHVGT